VVFISSREKGYEKLKNSFVGANELKKVSLCILLIRAMPENI